MTVMSKTELLENIVTNENFKNIDPIASEDILAEDSKSQNEHIEFGIDRSKQGSTLNGILSIICVVAGTGALGLPYALAQGGWIGLFILGLSWILSVYTGIILIRSMYYHPEKRLASYQEVATEAFGKIGGWLSFFFLAITLIGVPVLYLLLSGLNIHNVAAGTSAELTFPIWVIICSCIVAIPFLFFRSLKEISLLSYFGVLTTVIVIFIVLGVAVKDAPNQAQHVHHDSVIWNMFPIALSSIAFSFGGAPVFCHVEQSLKKRRDWDKVVTFSLTICVILYFCSSIPGYMVYGVDVQSPVYDSIPSGGPKTTSIILITIHLILATPILLTSFAIDVERMLKIGPDHRSFVVEWTLRFLFRGGLMVLVAVIAIFVPFFGDFMSLLGAFSNCALIFIFPVLFYYKLTGFRGKPWYDYILAFLTLLMGIVGLIFGTISAIQALNNDFKSKSPS
ncbi:transmembrane amino acid transporter protein-domain-containing protein [Cokeromyces recurvatus]|uniref:transmembrane amino acid transporter protein-domain-containing protein n=1 Tax=Cokeromyces recurvatus TaxID=90255 RepID=UPI002220CCD8|nr:transmembrane amino acid transporter protein-domain-containing protein [Cokeromyces recurvatus]KAI7902848.1 transmembrane amino acid transporter protein-domain-containing protein [Cokeromyces recurvatus]